MTMEEEVRRVVAGVVDRYLSDTVPAVPIVPETAGAAEPVFTVPVEASGRHVHLSPEDVETLFGPGYTLTPKRELSQPGQYLCEERITLVGPKHVFSNVAILGPPRGHTQVEVSVSDARLMGLNPPVALSGDLSQAGDMLLSVGNHFLMAQGSLIVARNHLHMSPEEAANAGLHDGDKVSIRVQGTRPLTFEEVTVRSGPGHKLAMHIDFDEANACGFVPGKTTGSVLGKCTCKGTSVESPSRDPGEVGPGDVVLSVSFLTETQVRDVLATGATAVVLPEHCIVSPLAGDLLSKHGIRVKRL